MMKIDLYGETPTAVIAVTSLEQCSLGQTGGIAFDSDGQR